MAPERGGGRDEGSKLSSLERVRSVVERGLDVDVEGWFLTPENFVTRDDGRRSLHGAAASGPGLSRKRLAQQMRASLRRDQREAAKNVGHGDKDP